MRVQPGLVNSQNYARSLGEAAYPELWRGILSAGIPAISAGSVKVYDFSQYKKQFAVTGSGYSWDQVAGYPAFSVTGATYYSMTLPRVTTTAYTVVSWQTMHGAGNNDSIGGSGNGYFRLFGNGGRTYAYLFNTSAGFFAQAYVTPTLAADQYYQLAVVADDAGIDGYLRTYYNGMLYNRVISKTGTLRSNDMFTVGAHIPTGVYSNYTGKMAGAIVYDRALTTNEVAQLYTLGPTGWLAKKQRRSFFGFGGGVGPQTITMPVVEATASAIAPTVTESAVTITMPVVEATASVVVPDIVGEQTITMPVAEATASAITQTVTQSAVTITMPVAEATASVIVPDIIAGTTIDPGIVSGTASVVAPSVSTSAVIIALPVVTASASAISPDTLKSPVTILLNNILGTSSVVVPNITFGARTVDLTVATGNGTIIVPTVTTPTSVIVPMPVCSATASCIAPGIQAGGVLDIAGMEYKDFSRRMHYKINEKRFHYRGEEE